VLIVGEAKTPDALQNASDQFFMWQAAEVVPAGDGGAEPKPAAQVPAPVKKRRSKALLDAAALMAESTGDGKVGLGALGQYMKAHQPELCAEGVWAQHLVGHGAVLPRSGSHTRTGQWIMGELEADTGGTQGERQMIIKKKADDKTKRLALLADLKKSALLDARQKEWLDEELTRIRRGIEGERDAAFYIDSYL